jgi:hypothetical protein
MGKKHARFSPSKLEGLEICPKYQREEDTVSSDEGTMMHDASENENTDGLSEEQRNAVQSAVGYKEILKSRRPDCKELKEVKLELKDLTFGFADVILLWDDEADVIDYKYGRLEVSNVSENLQIQTYCACVLEEYPNIQTIRGHAVQPRVGTPNSATFDRSLLQRTRDRIVAIYAKADDPFSIPVRSSQCDKCRNLHKCTAWKPTMMQVADLVQLPAPAILKGELEPTPQDRNVMQTLAIAIEKLAEQWKKANSKFVLEDGGTIPGFAIRERGTGPKVDQVAVALQRLKDNGYSNDQLCQALKMSIPNLATAMVEVRGGSEKDERAKILEILGDLVTEGKTRYLAKAGKGK